MSADWLEIDQCDIDACEVDHRVRERLSQRELPAQQEADSIAVARRLWRERIGPLVEGAQVDRSPGDNIPEGVPESGWISTWQDDCGLVPQNYRIDWRIPILGPIHALVRRVINGEIRRYLKPSLEKQSFLNRRVLRMLDQLARQSQSLARQNEALARENARLREEVERLRRGKE
jgi:hypothetical protein